MEVVKLDKVDSTNSWAKLNIDSIRDKTCVVADCQTSGRGRLNRSWVDLGVGNLFASLVLKPSESFNEIYPNLTQYLSVVICRVLEKFGTNPKIKWPNDILIDEKKIVGILSETVIEGAKLKGIVLGFGVNLKSNEKDLKGIPDKIATALNLEIGKEISPDEFLDEILKEFFDGYEEFLKSGFINIKEEYISRNCFLDKNINVQVFDKKYYGKAQEITNNGELILAKDDSERIVLTIGDINYE